MKYLLVLILSYVSLAYGAKSTDPPSDLTTKHPSTTPFPSLDGLSYNLTKGSKWSKVGYRVSRKASKFMATIRESPSELYLCSATFIRSDALLTTARCLIGRDTDKLSVHYNTSSLETEGQGNAAIKNVYLHPEFDMKPVTMDFGLIVLKRPVDSITPASLPYKKLGRPGTLASSYSWRLTNNSNKFLIHEHPSEIISNSKCFLLEREIIPDEKACAEGPPSEEGYFDNGMPFIVNRRGKNYLFGMNHISGKQTGGKVTKVWKVSEIVPWIIDTLREDDHETKKTTTQKPTTSTPVENEVPVVEDDEEEDEEDDIIGYNRLHQGK